MDWTCAAAPDEIAWYVALLLAAVRRACAAAPDGIERHVHLQYAAAGWACAAAYDGIAGYFAFLHAAVCWVCAAAFDENTRYVALLHSARGWACAAAPVEIAWYVDLLHAAVGRSDWDGLALLRPTGSYDTFICYTLQRDGPALLHRLDRRVLCCPTRCRVRCFPTVTVTRWVKSHP